ncbi:MAG: hypothetical protein FVQ79_00325 [Planctomycetes bacterium]|nr:hypothetical protein [Planctomycetota bacterium]
MSGNISEKSRLTEPAGMGPRILPTDAVRGFTQIAVCSGKPTGVPADIPGQIPIIFDIANGTFYAWYNDAWLSLGPGASTAYVDKAAAHYPTWRFTGPTGAVDGPAFYTDQALTFSQVNSVKGSAGTSVVFQLYWSNSRNAAGTTILTLSERVTNSTTGQEQTSFNDATIPADKWVWCEITAVTGTPEFLELTAKFTIDP